MSKFSITRLRYPDELEILYSFLRKVYAPDHILFDKKFFKWQFVEQNFSNVVLRNNDEIFGHVGLIGHNFVYHERRVLASFLSCLIVAENLRGRGAGAFLSREAERNLDAVYATGINEDGMSAFRALGWIFGGDLFRWIRTPKFEKSETKAREITNFDGSWNASWKDLQKKYGLTIDRTSQYLNWRFISHPRIDYKIFGVKSGADYDGYIVLRLEEGEMRALRIVDLVAKDANAEMELLKAAMSYAKDLNVDFVDFFCSSKMYENSFRRLGFFEPESSETQNIPIFILPLDNRRKSINWAYKIINLELKNIKKEDWFIVKADGDKDRPQNL